MTVFTKLTTTLLFGAHAALAGVTLTAQPDGLGGKIDASLMNEISAASDRGLSWLAAKQKPDGSWSNSDFPAISALCTWAFIRGEHPQKQEIVAKAIKYITSCVQPDGGIYRTIPNRKGGGLSNYNTAICMTTLHATGDPALRPIVLKARTFIAASQLTGEDQYAGGFGYDAKTERKYTDLMNTLYSAEAMRFTESAEDSRPKGEKRADIDWKKTAEFVTKLQNTPEAGKDEAGGFIYKPGESKAGSYTSPDGKLVLRSYGSMTYAGLLALIYADVDRDDPRVRSAFDWARNHWTLEENPGMGDQGLFFFYNVMARSLNAYGSRVVATDNDTYVDWRKQLTSKLVTKQKVDAEGNGFWLNETNRYWEADPVLVTAYSLLALQHAAGQ
jgi:squalene-hopene/tetraprenyl-beta-curcumene cyclase